MLKENRFNRTANDAATNETQVRFKWKIVWNEGCCCYSNMDGRWTLCVTIFIQRQHISTKDNETKQSRREGKKTEQMIVSVYNLFQSIFGVAAILRPYNCGTMCGRDTCIHTIIYFMHYCYYYIHVGVSDDEIGLSVHFLYNFTYNAHFWKYSLYIYAEFFVFDVDVKVVWFNVVTFFLSICVCA